MAPRRFGMIELGVSENPAFRASPMIWRQMELIQTT